MSKSNRVIAGFMLLPTPKQFTAWLHVLNLVIRYHASQMTVDGGFKWNAGTGRATEVR